MSKASKAVVRALKSLTAWTSGYYQYNSSYYSSVSFQATELPRSSQGERCRSIIEQIRLSCPVLSTCVCVCVSCQDEAQLHVLFNAALTLTCSLHVKIARKHWV